jgi:CRISPR/Cas system CSM-associated protein Csm4 (group 5 of RAMP superfamily)
MNDENEGQFERQFKSYKISVKMSRDEFDEWASKMSDLQNEIADIFMEVGGYKEANDVINHIKNLK